MSEKVKDVFILPLADDGSPVIAGGHNFINLPVPEDPYTLRFVVFSSSAIVNHGSLWCNVPPPGTPFERFKFYQYPINAGFHRETYIDISIWNSGAFAYYFTYNPISNSYFDDYTEDYESETETESESRSDSDSENSPGSTTSSTDPYSSEYSSTTSLLARTNIQEQHLTEAYVDLPLSCTNRHYFLVSAGFTLDNKPLPLTSLSIQSVISKWMGPFSTWEEKLSLIKEKGYNMIHFTPLQPSGLSNSPYSIYDQLKFDPKFFPNGESDIKQLIDTMEHHHQLLSLTDVVLNHTAHNSEWLKVHPEAGYSTETAPHLTPALDLDTSLLDFSANLSKYGLPTDINSFDDLGRIMNGIKSHVFDNVKLWEFYTLDVDFITLQVLDRWNRGSDILEVPSSAKSNLPELAKFVLEHAAINFDKFGHKRYIRSLDVGIFTSIVRFLKENQKYTPNDPSFRELIISILNEINLPLYRDYDSDSGAILDQLFNRIKYTRLDDNGPKMGPITDKHPLVETYFTRIITKSGRKVALANNGWIWNGNPLVDFASAQSRAYLRREVIIWGDCVKLRYGNGPEDSSYLWDRMTRYTQLLAKYFHGFRIDNCHSTPLHVGEYLLDKARLIRPNLYVVAELFTGSEDMDRVFVERLGITALIREAMQAWSVEELSRLVHRHGGRPIGSFSKQPIVKYGRMPEDNSKIHLVRSSAINALFMDCTHDNETPAQKRTVEDTLPNAALVAMCACSVGTVMGYDECYPHLLDIVGETRSYVFGGGISKIKRTLLDVHDELGRDNAEEMHVHHEGQYITVHRVSPRSGSGWFLIARTKFSSEGEQHSKCLTEGFKFSVLSNIVNDIKLNGTFAKSILSVQLVRTGDAKEDPDLLKGIPTEVKDLEPPSIEYDKESKTTTIRVGNNFPQGSIALLKTSVDTVDSKLDKFVRTGADEAVSKIGFLDLNVIMYKCDSEEREASHGHDGVYSIPNYGDLTYAGLQGWISPLVGMVSDNNLAHLISDHLRAGQWALDYVVGRLDKYLQDFPNVAPFQTWLKARFDAIRVVPSFLLPRYFSLVLFTAYSACRSRALALMPKGINSGTFFLQDLALTSIQMVGKIPSTSLFPFVNSGSMAAGLPFFSHDYMRCWGRDVFLSLRGLLVLTGRVNEAKQHILAFAATLKHGLIPNLLDAGRNPRYNARDATWFFAQILQEYSKHVTDGTSILDEKVKRRFPLDDTWVPVDDSRAFSYETSIRDILYEILARHARGIKFREANAGPNLDSQMRDQGFNQEIHVDWDSGFIFGGNQWNCGTWMDKMGESERAHNKGYPGTPRDGAAIEITGLLKSTLRWVNELNKDGIFPYDSVVNQHGETILFTEWESRLQRSFEYSYYIPQDRISDSYYDINPNIVHRRGIYKDLYRSGNTFEDYQLRPNFAIAMCVAPELFDIDHAIGAIAVADRLIRGPVGMATLDPGDLNYRPYYDNGNDSDDFQTSKGRNYHQGPEWLWCTGYFLRAFLKFDLARKDRDGGDITETFQQISSRLAGHRAWIRGSHWAGLTELTNKDGGYCADSSPTQAWSSATLIDLFEDARQHSQELSS